MATGGSHQPGYPGVRLVETDITGRPAESVEVSMAGVNRIPHGGYSVSSQAWNCSNSGHDRSCRSVRPRDMGSRAVGEKDVP